ncbi:hypothetical protein [Enhygromyxa salina]|uniref:hypothetical protein n=1 Tax=Enhygromyxa salina TaxID=215803 RepID=UPI0011BAC85B|nr:hypothetical protein [Enhygromyxa salina]
MRLSEHRATQVLALLAEFAPQQHKMVRGLPDAAISAVQRDLGCVLCAGHITFLRVFGATPKGAMNPFIYDHDFSVDAMRDYYRRYEETPVNQIMFWAYTHQYWTPGYLFASGPDVQDPATGATTVQISVESFWNVLLFDAYVFLISVRYEHESVSGWLWEGHTIPLDRAAEPFAEVEAILTQLGFEPWMDMANAKTMMRRGDTIACFGRSGMMPNPDDWYMNLSAPTPREQRELWEVFADHVGLVEHPRYR